jgi:hypothetical protein
MEFYANIRRLRFAKEGHSKIFLSVILINLYTIISNAQSYGELCHLFEIVFDIKIDNNQEKREVSPDESFGYISGVNVDHYQVCHHRALKYCWKNEQSENRKTPNKTIPIGSHQNQGKNKFGILHGMTRT